MYESGILGIIIISFTVIGSFFLKENNDTDRIVNKLFFYTGLILSNISFSVSLILKEISKLS